MGWGRIERLKFEIIVKHLSLTRQNRVETKSSNWIIAKVTLWKYWAPFPRKSSKWIKLGKIKLLTDEIDPRSS